MARNPHPESGQLGSTCLGIEALPGDVRTVIVYPVDHYAVSDDDVTLILSAVDHCGPEVGRIVPRFEGRGGHPVVLLPPAVAALRAGPDPAQSTLREVLDVAGSVYAVHGVGAGVRRNLNTPTDLPESGASLARETQ